MEMPRKELVAHPWLLALAGGKFPLPPELLIWKTAAFAGIFIESWNGWDRKGP